ncbi:helix-turn-helix domain-containing protein [Flagellimonas meridianipacifica]|uniref:AraC-like DNA-binding protein n=1 Tax=Flagellimonas meridianipacifica TaxID=1080225 RepID=A0A2T0MDE6_9FLAO|nr:helix-turn-helix transcriptional regulator [Allomuricauda pacifica]PRX55507.1 AraC-like DNA-binding protein [Allomuricauda pacifica]
MKIRKSGVYYGIKKTELKNFGFSISEYDYHLPETDWHYHENPYFMFVLGGNLKDLNKKGTRLCPQGSFLFLNWQEIHKNTKESSHAKGFHIELDKRWFKEKQLERGLWEGSKLITNPNLHHTLAKIYYEFMIDDVFSSVSMETLVLQLCDGLWKDYHRSHKMEPAWLNTLEDLIYNDEDILSLENLSAKLGIHPVHLSRSFPKYHDITLGEYIRRHKVKKSIPLLMNSKFSLTQIAYSSGFSDQSHYTRTFKKYFNATPIAFRQAFK